MKSIRTLTLFLAVVVASAGEVEAQTGNSAIVRHLVPVQMVESLSSPQAMIRSQTLKNVIFYSTFRRNTIDLGDVVATIAEIAREDDSRSNRRLAVAALRAIDSYQARRYLANLGGMEDPEYQSLIAGVLKEYQDVRRTGSL